MAKHDDAEAWVRSEWLPRKFGQGFTKDKVRLEAGGTWECDAVSGDARIGVAVTTCTGRTKGGNGASGKKHKIREDILFLLMASFSQRLVVLTDPEMFEWCETERRKGRMPAQIEFVLVELPPSACVGERGEGGDGE